MFDTVSIEDLGRPATALVNVGFVNDARSAASSKGMPGLRITAETIPPECTIKEQIEAGVSAALDDIIAALTKPLTAEEEKAPKPTAVEKPPRIIFKGDLKEVNRFFYKSGWNDGLPIVPPTEEEVKEMLTGTDLPADHVVAKIVPRLGKATVEKIAINAVMAGALPTYMPVLIAAGKVIQDPVAHFPGAAVTTGSSAPFWIINGPIRKDLKVNSGSGALSPGDIANAAIGRAMGLIIKNIGGIRKGMEDMGVYGNPGKYSMVLAENEEGSPWEPLHVQHGLKKEDSAITVSFGSSPVGSGVHTTDDKGILSAMTHGLSGRGQLATILLNPTHAGTMASNGWTKEDIQTYVAEYTRIPAYQHQAYQLAVEGKPNAAGVRRRHVPINPTESMPVFTSGPAGIRVVVAGGPGSMSIGIVGGGGWAGMSWVTQKIELPANWSSLVEKYKDIVPTYVRY